MKIFTTVLLTLFLSSLLWGQTKEQQWSNGNKKSEGAYTAAGLKTGAWKFYYENGKLEAEGSYSGVYSADNIDVIRKGRNSAIEDEGTTRVEDWTFYYDNGAKKGTISYQEGCPTGKLIKWYKEGSKMEEVEYIDCKPIGDRKVWHRDGWLKYETLQEDDGKSVEMEYYSNTQKKSSVPYRDGQQYGKVKRWYQNGQKEEDVMMKNTRVHGSYRSWYSNGNPKREFFSINNVMNGTYREWTKDGTLLWEIREMKEEKGIEVKNYWTTGEVKMEGKASMPTSLSIHQWSQSREGYWTYYHKDGTVLKSEKYSKGKLINVQMP